MGQGDGQVGKLTTDNQLEAGCKLINDGGKGEGSACCCCSCLLRVWC